MVNWLVVPEPADCAGVLPNVVIEESVPHSNHAVVARPFGVTFPFRVASLAPTDVADKVAAVGDAPGVKLDTDPRVVPDKLLAATRKWYVSPIARPLREVLVNWPVVPDPADCVEVLLMIVIEESVPHSNHAVVARPFGVTCPFRVASVAPTEVADNVVAVGAAPGVKLEIEPRVVPDPLLDATRKW